MAAMRQDLARARLQELEQLRLQIYKELAPYQARNEKPPARLSKSLEENEEAISARGHASGSVHVMQNRFILNHPLVQKSLPNLFVRKKRKCLYSRLQQTQCNRGGPTARHRIRHRQRDADVHHIIGCRFRQRAGIAGIK